MIRRMRFRFIAITMGALFFLLAAILITMNVYMNRQSDKQLLDHLHDLAIHDGEPRNAEAPPGMQPPSQKDLIEGFAVKVDSSGEIIEMLDDRSNIESEAAEQYVSDVMALGNTEGVIDSMRYLVQEKSYGKIVVFADRSIQDVMLDDLRNLSYFIGGASLVMLFGIVFVLSKLTTRPVEEAFEKQKRFIADSSHELKTPLSILSANADVMEMEIGRNKWLEQIKAQSRRMNALIHDLLTLAKTETTDGGKTFAVFNLSRAITNAVLPFEVVAFEQGKTIVCEIEDNVVYNGDERSIKKMMEALVDNAVKYSEDDSEISVKLAAKGAKKTIEVFNKGQGVTLEQKDRLFEKFYRTDDSRARETGGYGIGLSIVKNIVDMHHGRIETESKLGEFMLFRVILSDR